MATGSHRGALAGRQTTSEAVADTLRAEILAGEHAPGERLRQGEVARRLGISITPVREAFTQLRAEGLLRGDMNRGVQVFAPKVADLRELYDIRIALERLAMRHAAARIDKAEVDALEWLVREMGMTSDHDAYLQTNKDFHTQLYAAAEMPRLTDLVHTLRDQSDVYLHLFVVELDDSKMNEIRSRSDDDHRAILEACRVRDADAAERTLDVHLRHTLGAVIDLLNAQAETPAPVPIP